jgi:hypothetical protein
VVAGRRERGGWEEVGERKRNDKDEKSLYTRSLVNQRWQAE